MVQLRTLTLLLATVVVPSLALDTNATNLRGSQNKQPASLAASCCSGCSGNQYCNPRNGKCFDSKKKDFFEWCPASCCGGCSDNQYCNPRNGKCFDWKKKDFFEWCPPGTPHGPKMHFPRTQIRWNPDVSYCLSADGNRIANGVKIQLWQCDSSWQASGQVFNADFSATAATGYYDGLIRVKQDPSYCLVVDADRFVNGARIQLWKCDERNDAQRWRLWGDKAEGHGTSGLLSPAADISRSKCLVIDYNKAYNGAKIQLWDCGSADDLKRWSFGYQALASQRSSTGEVSNLTELVPVAANSTNETTTIFYP